MVAISGSDSECGDEEGGGGGGEGELKAQRRNHCIVQTPQAPRSFVLIFDANYRIIHQLLRHKHSATHRPTNESYSYKSTQANTHLMRSHHSNALGSSSTETVTRACAFTRRGKHGRIRHSHDMPNLGGVVVLVGVIAVGTVNPEEPGLLL